MIYFLFFLSGFSALVYQLVWVRVFGNVFGNTVYSASLVVAVFMLGLGLGSLVIGGWADRRYASAPNSLLRMYAYVEFAIAALAFGLAGLLPHLGDIVAGLSAYSRDASGWYVLAWPSYASRVAVAVLLLTPITLLMGGTLTLLIRHLVRQDVDEVGGWRIAALYAVNTCGAALGALLTDFALVPAYGLRAAQLTAVSLNVVAALGALLLAARSVRIRKPAPTKRRKVGNQVQPDVPLTFTSVGLFLSGFAAMGMEILWFRHFSILLGGFRAVFAILLTVILVGIGVGSLAGGMLHRWTRRPAECLMAIQALFIVTVLAGLAAADGTAVDAAQGSGNRLTLAGEIVFNARPIVAEVLAAALLMGFSFPLANAIVQRTEQVVAWRAGLLYLANTAGAVCGALGVGFVLLPSIGMQQSATVLAALAGSAVLAWYFAGRRSSATPPRGLSQLMHYRPGQSFHRDIPAATTPGSPPRLRGGVGAARPGVIWEGHGTRAVTMPLTAAAAIALALWAALPSDYLLARALPSLAAGERLIALDEGVNEVISVVEAGTAERRGDVPGDTEERRRGVPGDRGARRLLTNGHSMSSTEPAAQRYMRALAHVPLLSIDRPRRVLVIGFGVGNTTHAATLHPSVERVDVADLSNDVLRHAAYFSDANEGILQSPKVAVHVNDGRHHLRMQPGDQYDLITLEPPPPAYAGMAALYSREFYALARSRLKAGGYLSQWLPAYQLPTASSLAMTRAFIDVFPQAVLISGAESELVLLGARDAAVRIDPARVSAAARGRDPIGEDLRRLDLGGVREIVGTFLASSSTLESATRGVEAVTDDRPIQEYGVRSLLSRGESVPSALVDVSRVAEWCPACFVDGGPAPEAEGLDTYLALLELAYSAPPESIDAARRLGNAGRTVAGSAYLGRLVPESAAMHNILGISLARAGDMAAALAEFRAALRLDPDSAATHWHLGAALASTGARADAIAHLRRSVEIDPRNEYAQSDLRALMAHAERAVPRD